VPERRSPFHELFAARGAVFDGTTNWLYPIWFETPATPNREAALVREHHLVRESVGVIDCTVLAEIALLGPDALRVVNHLSTSDLDLTVGTVAYTHWCDEDGRILVDAVIARHGPDHFVVVVNDTVQQTVTQLANEMIKSLKVSAVAIDMTSAVATLIVAGPLVRDLLQPLTSSPLDTKAFPPFTFQQIDIAGVSVQAMRVAYVGELTFELHIPTEYAYGLGVIILQAAEKLGGGAVGLDAVYALGSEHGMFDFDYNFDQTFSPIEAGVGYTIHWDKPEGFRGREALVAHRSLGAPQRRMAFAFTYDLEVTIRVGDVLCRDGAEVARVVTVDRAHTVGAQLAAVCVQRSEGVTAEWMQSGVWSIVGSHSVTPVLLTTKALYEPNRVKSRS
jgi:glycine cleavage system aminomethyltransferase T